MVSSDLQVGPVIELIFGSFMCCYFLALAGFKGYFKAGRISSLGLGVVFFFFELFILNYRVGNVAPAAVISITALTGVLGGLFGLIRPYLKFYRHPNSNVPRIVFDRNLLN